MGLSIIHGGRHRLNQSKMINDPAEGRIPMGIPYAAGRRPDHFPWVIKARETRLIT
jgi:hypothetical protein